MGGIVISDGKPEARPPETVIVPFFSTSDKLQTNKVSFPLSFFKSAELLLLFTVKSSDKSQRSTTVRSACVSLFAETPGKTAGKSGKTVDITRITVDCERELSVSRHRLIRCTEKIANRVVTVRLIQMNLLFTNFGPRNIDIFIVLGIYVRQRPDHNALRSVRLPVKV